MAANGLGSIGDLSNLLDDDVNSGQPLELDISLVDDDPNNREDVPQEFLEELAADIKERGVKSPISVRDHPFEPGRYMTNFGHNRKISSIMAGKKTIPAFIDNDFDEFDQVKENLKRAKLTSRDLTKFIERKLNDGMKKGEIAKRLGKSAALISQHITLLKLPAPVQVVFDSGRCEDVTVINELVKLQKKHPEEVSAWLSDEDQEITRGSLKLLNEFVDSKDAAEHEEEQQEELQEESSEAAESKKAQTEEDPEKFKKAIIQLEYQGRPARIVLTKRPTEPGMGWIKFDDDGDVIEIPLSDATIVELIEG